jgi:hypothetical protein
MISIEVEVKVNGEPIKVAGKLNDLVAWFITQRLVSDEGVTASFAAPTAKVNMTHVKGIKKSPWSAEQEQTLITQATTLRQEGKTWGQINQTIAGILGKSYGSIWAKTTKLRRIGRIQ